MLGRAIALAVCLGGCSHLPHLVWPNDASADDPGTFATFDAREATLCAHADDVRIATLSLRVFGGIADPAAYDQDIDGLYAFCVIKPDGSAEGLFWLTGRVRELHGIGEKAGAVIPPMP